MSPELPSVYRENLNHHMPRHFLSELAYEEMVRGCVIVCADAAIVQRSSGTMFLARRRHKPMAGWWIIGGRVNVDEMFEDAVSRAFAHETSLKIPSEDFKCVCLNRYRWENREQEPQNVGSDNLAFTFAVELSDEQIKQAAASLDEEEYDRKTGLVPFSLRQLREGLHAPPPIHIHPMLVDLYSRIFP